MAEGQATRDWRGNDVTQEHLNPVPPYSKYVAIRDFPGETAHDLPFSVGDVITVLEPCNVVFWYLGENSVGRRGVIPINFLEAVCEQKKPSHEQRKQRSHHSVPVPTKDVHEVTPPPRPPKTKGPPAPPAPVKSARTLTQRSKPAGPKKTLKPPHKPTIPCTHGSTSLPCHLPDPPTYTDIDRRPPAPLPPEAQPMPKSTEPVPPAKYSSQLEFVRKSGWFSPTVETVLCKKMGNANLAAFANSAGIYHFNHMDHACKCYTARSKNADIVQMFHQLYDKPHKKLSPLEFELKYNLPDAKGWMIRLFTVSDPELIYSEEVWHIAVHRTLQPDGLNKQLTFHSKEHFYEFAEKYAKQLREKKP